MVISGPWKQKATFGVRAAGFVTLIGWWWCNRTVLQESCAHSDVTILRLGGGPSSVEDLKDIVTHISFLRGTRTLSEGCATLWLFLLCFCIPSLPWLTIVWIHPLELREGQGVWRKSISYRQEKENREQNRSVLQTPTESCSVLI